MLRTRNFKLITMAAVLLTVAACGGGSGPDPVTYQSLSSEEANLRTKADGIVNATTPVLEPPVADASYNGVMLVQDGSDVNFGSYLGDFSASYTFSTEQFNGTANNFFYDSSPSDVRNGSGTAVAGAVTLDGNGIKPSGTIDVIVGGSIETLNAAGNGEITFIGAAGDMVVGEATNATLGARTTMTYGIIAD